MPCLRVISYGPVAKRRSNRDDGARKQIEQTVATTASMIDKKIEKYEEERTLLYG